MTHAEFPVPEDLDVYFSIKENVTEFVNRVQNITAEYDKSRRILNVKTNDQRALNKADMILELYFKDARKKGPQKKTEDGQRKQEKTEAVIMEKITQIHLDDGDNLVQSRKRLLEAETALYSQRMRHEEERHQVEMTLLREKIATEKTKQIIASD